MMRPWWIFVVAWPAWGHVVSMSSGDLIIEGAHARFELRMPLYEMVHVHSPERALLEHIRFAGARLTTQSCRTDAVRDVYLCTAEYEFASPPERVDVECTLAAITVPSHVHLLRAQMDGKQDQGIFDRSFTRATLRFRPPSPAEIVLTQAGAGLLRALGGPVQVLFLAALVLAARTRRELLALAAMFVAGEAASVLVAPHAAWQPNPRFVEAAAALTVAYLSVEILLLPKAGARWLIAGVLGLFHGLYFRLFIQTSGYSAIPVLSGAVLAEIAAIALLALLFRPLGRLVRALRPVEVSASALLVFGMVWFFLRLKS